MDGFFNFINSLTRLLDNEASGMRMKFLVVRENLVVSSL